MSLPRKAVANRNIVYTSTPGSAVTFDPPILWFCPVGAGNVVLKDERGTSVTYPSLAGNEGGIVGPFSELTSFTTTRLFMGDGNAPRPAPGSAVATAATLGSVSLSVAPASAASPIAVGTNDGRMDYTVGTALTDTATTTVQRAAIKTSFLLAGTMSQGETITLGTTGAVEGDYIKIIRTSTSAQTAAIVNGGVGAGTLFTMIASKQNWLEARYNGTNWLIQGMGQS